MRVPTGSFLSFGRGTKQSVAHVDSSWNQVCYQPLDEIVVFILGSPQEPAPLREMGLFGEVRTDLLAFCTLLQDSFRGSSYHNKHLFHDFKDLRQRKVGKGKVKYS